VRETSSSTNTCPGERTTDEHRQECEQFDECHGVREYMISQQIVHGIVHD
jgi:hypothetical protein